MPAKICFGLCLRKIPSILHPSFISMIILTSKCGVLLVAYTANTPKAAMMWMALLLRIREVRSYFIAQKTDSLCSSFFMYYLILSRRTLLQYHTTYYSFPIHISPFITETYKILHNFFSWYISQSTTVNSIDICLLHLHR